MVAYKKTVCVFCGMAEGDSDIFSSMTILLAEHLAKSNVRVVYGGGSKGLMGLLADTVLVNNGEIIGVILDKDYKCGWGHKCLSSVHVVKDVNERKRKMIDLGDAFIALPGGVGTLDEIASVILQNHTKCFDKKCGLLNVDGFYDGLIMMYEAMRVHEFIRKVDGNMLVCNNNPVELIRDLGVI